MLLLNFKLYTRSFFPRSPVRSFLLLLVRHLLLEAMHLFLVAFLEFPGLFYKLHV